MFLVTTEHNEDGVWLDDPNGFDSETEAREWCAKQPPPPKDHSRVIYRCMQLT
jgi:hypothetical protein